MPVKITSVEFSNEYRPEKTDWLLGVLNEQIIAKIKISVGWFAIATPADTITFTCDGYPDPQELIQSESPVFADFKVGDIIDTQSVSNTNTALVVTEKISDFIIRVGGHTFTPETSASATVIGKTPITAMSFFYGLIENNEPVNYLSKVDNSSQKFSASALSAADIFTYVTMTPQGGKAWRNGYAVIVGDGVDTYYQKFIILHTFYILPYYLDGQFEDIQNLIKPDYFKDLNSLKYVALINALYSITDPNNIQSGVIENKLGNVGWFNEKFNNDPTNYSIDSVVYKTPALVILDSVEASVELNTFKIVVKNTTDAPFSNVDTIIHLGFGLAPEAEVYQDQSKTFVENMVFDLVSLILGAGLANGTNIGTDGQLFIDVNSTFISASEIEITGTISMLAPLVEKIAGLADKKYIIWLTVQNHTLDTVNSDKVTLLVDANEFIFPVIDDGMIEFVTDFIPHNDIDDTGVTATNAFPGDEIIVRSIIAFDLTGRDGNLIDFKTLSASIIVEKTGDSFILDSFSYDFANDTKVAGVTYVNFMQNRVFKLPLNDKFRLIKIIRRQDLDAGDIYYYEVRFPILFRWEYWVPLAGVSNDFFNSSLPHNGKNHFWHQYNSGVWKVNAKISLTTNNDGAIGSYNSIADIPSNDYNSNPDWINENIKSYNLTGLELTSGADKFVQGFDKTRIEASFEKPSGFTSADISVVIWAIAKETGGIATRTRISSLYDVGSESWFESVDTSNRVKLTFTGNVVTAEAILNNTKIPSVDDLTIYARIYEGIDASVESKLLEDGERKLLETGDYKLID